MNRFRIVKDRFYHCAVIAAAETESLKIRLSGTVWKSREWWIGEYRVEFTGKITGNKWENDCSIRKLGGEGARQSVTESVKKVTERLHMYPGTITITEEPKLIELNTDDYLAIRRLLLLTIHGSES
jgi:hypothetical protein